MDSKPTAHVVSLSHHHPLLVSHFFFFFLWLRWIFIVSQGLSSPVACGTLGP